MSNATDIQTFKTIPPVNAPSSAGSNETTRHATRGVRVRSRRMMLTMMLLAVPSIAFADNAETGGEGASALSAPMSPSARVASQVQSFYDRTDTLQTRFSQSYYHGLYRTTERATGTLILDKPGRMRFDYSNGKVMVASSGYLTMYEPGDDGEPGQYAKMRSSSDTTHQGFAFLMGHTRIDEDYNYRLLDAERYGWRGSLLELRPKVADAGVRRVLLYVDGRSGREGVVHRIRIDDHDGNRNTLTFRSMRFNRVLNTERFQYQPPVGSVRMN